MQAKKQVEKRQLEHGLLPAQKKISNGGTTLGRGVSVDQGLQQKDQPLDVKIIKVKDVADDGISEIHDRRVSQEPLKKSSVLKQLKEFQLYDLRYEEQKD